MERETHTIDATNQPPGRLATQIATLLMGKHKVNYLPHADIGDNVVVENVQNMKLSKEFLAKKVYHHHSGYPGGIKTTQAKHMPNQNVLKKAVYNMLPKNKLRALMIKRLIIQ